MRRVRKLLETAPGPTPWYWTSFPEFGSGERTWSWRLERPDDEINWWPVLQSDWDGAARFVPGAYTYAADAGDGHMLVWRGRLSGSIGLRLHRLEDLPAFALRQPGWRKRDTARRRAVELVVIPRLSAGVHEGFAPRTPVAIEEVLLLASWPTSQDDDPAVAVYAWAPNEGTVTVLPQPWFNAAAYDLGYQWVTRVVRDARTGRIVGDGIRISGFELDDDGMSLRRWLWPKRV